MNRAERRRLAKEGRKQKVMPQFMREELMSSAMQELQGGNLSKADKLFKKLIKSSPEDPTALHFAGITKYQLGLYKEALELLNQAARVAPNYPEVYNSQGIVLLEQREYERARQCFEHAISLKGNYSNAHANLGNSLRGLNDFSNACVAYKTAIQLDPKNSEAIYNLAATLLANNDSAAALVAADNCLSVDPYCQNASAYKAIALSQLDRQADWKLLYNFDEMIHKTNIEVPKNYESLDNFNTKLVQDIRNHPTLTWEPLERVTRGGAVTKDILLKPSKTISAFKKMLCLAIDEYRNNLPYDANHPFYSRSPKKYRLTLIASILKANGRHPPHIHESSWLSGVYYVRIPTEVNDVSGDKAGWLEFGKPDFVLPEGYAPKATAIKPEEGAALFFPSYFFHGTIPFTGSEERIGIAFDVYPLE